MLLHEIKEIRDGQCITFDTIDGGVGSGVKGHVTAKQIAAMKVRQFAAAAEAKKRQAKGPDGGHDGSYKSFAKVYPGMSDILDAIASDNGEKPGDMFADVDFTISDDSGEWKKAESFAKSLSKDDLEMIASGEESDRKEFEKKHKGTKGAKECFQLIDEISDEVF